MTKNLIISLLVSLLLTTNSFSAGSNDTGSSKTKTQYDMAVSHINAAKKFEDYPLVGLIGDIIRVHYATFRSSNDLRKFDPVKDPVYWMNLQTWSLQQELRPASDNDPVNQDPNGTAYAIATPPEFTEDSEGNSIYKISFFQTFNPINDYWKIFIF